MPNLQGTSPIGHDDGDRSYLARTDSSGRPRQRCRVRSGLLRKTMTMIGWRNVRAERAGVLAVRGEGDDPIGCADVLAVRGEGDDPAGRWKPVGRWL